MLSLVLRLALLTTHVYRNGDEYYDMNISFRMLFNDLDPGFFLHPTLNFNLVSAAFMIVHAVFGGHSDLQFPLSLCLHYQEDPYLYLAAGRVISLLSGMGSIVIVYLIARFLWGKTSSLFAALFLGVSLCAVDHSQIITSYGVGVFMGLVAFYYFVRLHFDGRPAHYILSGLFFGLAVSSNYVMGLMILAFFAAHFPPAPGGSCAGSTRSFVKTAALMAIFAACALVSFFVASPYALLDYQQFLGEIASRFGDDVRPMAASSLQDFLYYVKLLTWEEGVPALIAAFAGLVWFIWKRERTEAFVWLFPAVYFVVFSMSEPRGARYLTPFIPFFALLVGRLAGRVSSLVRDLFPQTTYVAVTFGMLVALNAYPLGVTWHHLEKWADRKGYREFISDWVPAQVPDESLVLVLGTRDSFLEFLNPLAPYQPTADTWRFKKEMSQCMKSGFPGRTFYFFLAASDSGPVRLTIPMPIRLQPSAYLIFADVSHWTSQTLPGARNHYSDFLATIRVHGELLERLETDEYNRDLEIYRVNTDTLLGLVSESD